MKAWLVCLVLIISAAVVDQAWANESDHPPKDRPRSKAPNFGFLFPRLMSDHPCSKAGGPYPGCDYKTTPRKMANVYSRGCSKFHFCRTSLD